VGGGAYLFNAQAFYVRIGESKTVLTSVADPYHFDADPDPTSEKTWIRIRPNDADPCGSGSATLVLTAHAGTGRSPA
jgi:hypothetical protein